MAAPTAARHAPEAALRTLVERVPAIVYVAELGAEGRWHYVSPQIESILGFTPEEWTADPGLWSRQIHPEDRERVLSFETERYLDLPGAPPAEYRMLSRMGETVWILEEARLESAPEGIPLWHGVMYDITHRKRIERDVQRLANQQAAVARLGERALAGVEPEQLMQQAAALLARGEHVDHACVWTAGPAGLRLRHGPESHVRGPVAPERAHVAEVLASGLPVRVDDWAVERRFAPPAGLAGLAVRSSAAVVIDGKGGPFGVLDVHSGAPAAFSGDDVHFLQAVANVLATAVERRAADEALRHRASHDALTGLPNRESFLEALAERLDRAQRSGGGIAVLFFDLDDFKLVNDTLGHHAGDELLRSVAGRLTSALGAGDVVARFGGDEFAILLDGVGAHDEAIEIAGRVAAELAQPVPVGGLRNYVTASIGIATSRPKRSGITAETLLREADAAMYAAKGGGKARHALYDATTANRARRRLEIQRDLQKGLGRRELLVHYQPILSLRSGAVEAVEALVRWRHPTLGLLAPDEFIPLVEDRDAIEPIGRWVLDRALADAGSWPGPLAPRVAVNVAARQLSHHGLESVVTDALERTRIAPERLEVEITEGALLDGAGSSSRTLAALSRLGVRVVLDDFGTGYSALGYLDRFELDGLKIDRAFVERLNVDERGRAIVEAIVAMARALSLEVTAEGVATREQARILREMGCDRVQGFLYSKPVAAARAPAAASAAARRAAPPR